MTRVSRTRLARLRSDVACPHCETELAAPVAAKRTDEELAAMALQSLRQLDRQDRAEAAARTPSDRTFSDWISVVEIPNDSKGADLLEHLTRLRDEVAASVGG